MNNRMQGAAPISDWQPLSTRRLGDPSGNGSHRAALSVSNGSVSADEVENMIGVSNASGAGIGGLRPGRQFVPRLMGSSSNAQAAGQYESRMMNPSSNRE